MPTYTPPSTLSRAQQPVVAPKLITLTTTRQLKASENGAQVLLNSATAFTTTLPKTAKGLNFRFIVKTKAGATGHVIAVQAATDVVVGTDRADSATGSVRVQTAGTAGKGRLNTQATSFNGDAIDFVCDGTTWYATPVAGIWAIQP